MEALIKLTTQEGQVVLDPFCGSGSTLVAAKKLNRKYIGIEFSVEFCKTARERLETETSEEKPKVKRKKKNDDNPQQLSFDDLK